MNNMQEIIEAAWKDRLLLKDSKVINCINAVIEAIDKGELRTAEPTADGWQVNDWVKKAVILYFPIREMETYSQNLKNFADVC